MAKNSAPTGRIHRHLHLQQHAHTGRRLHHRHTSYPGLAIVLVLAGVFIVGLGMAARATADTLTVYAVNPAPIPADPAIITNPTEGENFSKSTITVSGTCPVITPQVIIAVLDNGTLGGSVPCDADNKFSLSIVITPGVNTLVARVYTITGDTGVDSTPVHVTYSIPVLAGGVTGSSEQAEAVAGTPLVVTIDEPFIVFGPGKDAIWSGTITGGTLPYHVHLNWSDSSSSDYTVTHSGHQDFVHHYRSMQPHLITMRVLDSGGRGIIRSFAAVTPYRPPAPVIIGSTSKPFGGSTGIGLYGAYLITLAALGYLWIRARRTGSFAFAKAPVSVKHTASRRSASAKRRKNR